MTVEIRSGLLDHYSPQGIRDYQTQLKIFSKTNTDKLTGYGTFANVDHCVTGFFLE